VIAPSVNLLLGLFGCSTSSPDPSQADPTPQSQPVTIEFGQLIAPVQNPVSVQDFSLHYPYLLNLPLPNQGEVVGLLNLVQAPCESCWSTTSLAQCAIELPADCSNLPTLVSTAIQDYEKGSASLRVSLTYTDIWVPPGDDVNVDVVLWVSPAAPLLQESLLLLDALSTINPNRTFSVSVFSREGKDDESAVAASLAAGKQGLQISYLKSLMAQSSRNSNESLAAAARSTQGLNFDKWESVLEEFSEDVEYLSTEANSKGVRSSPTWFVDGYRMRGFQSQDALQRLITQRFPLPDNTSIQ